MGKVPTIFFGTSPFAKASLEALTKSPSVEIRAVVTQPDRPKGRHMAPQPSAVKEAALALGVPILQPEKARHPDFLQALAQFQAELIVVAAYGQILPQSLLDLPCFGALNVHGSLLPKYRGAAPIQWAILNDEAETGVTIMKMDAGLDTGPMLTKVTTKITPEDTAQSLHDRLALLGARLLVETIPSYISGAVPAIPQPSTEATYAPKILKEHGLVDWNQPARTVWNRIRAFTPWPGGYTRVPAGDRNWILKLWQVEPCEGEGSPGTVLDSSRAGVVVACGGGAIRIIQLQKEGGKRLSAYDFVAGNQLPTGTVLS